MRIAVLDDYQDLARHSADWSAIEARADVKFFHDPITEQSELITALQSFDVICLMRERTPFPKAVIEALPALKLIVTTGMKNAAIDMAAAVARGVAMCGTASPPHATAELTITLLLALARRLVPQVQGLRTGRWQDGIGRDVKGATLGLIGLGRLGAQVAAMAQAFDMNVIAWSQNLTAERCRELGVERVEKAELFARSHYVSIHLRLSARSAGLVGQAELATMSASAYLINTSRGPIVDQTALIDALETGSIAGAALDVSILNRSRMITH